MLGGAYRKTFSASTKANHMFFKARRSLFGASTAALAAVILAGCTPEKVNGDPTAISLIQRFGASEIQRMPEEADMIGVSPAAFGRPYSDLLNDRSMAVIERGRTAWLEYLAEFERIDRSTLSPDALRAYDSVRSVLEASIAVDVHGFGQTQLGWSSPFVISFNDGAFTDLVKFLTLHAPVRSRAEADAWLKRLEGMDEAMRDERRRFEVDLDAGVVPPRSVLQRTLDKARQFQPANPRDHVLVLHFTEALAQIADIPEDDIAKLTGRAADLVGGDILKEYAALIKLLEDNLAKAPVEPGVWRLPDGETYYAELLRLHTTTGLTPIQLNDMGKKLVEQITAQLDPLLAEAGLVEGSVGARLRQLALRPDLQYPDTPEGRVALMELISNRMKWGNGVATRVAAVDKPAEIVVRETPRIAQDTASKAYYRPAPLDGSLPGIYNLTLRSTADFPTWTLPTLTFHEGSPGHHLQVEAARDRADRPLIDDLIFSPAFNEGWATYAEDLAAELGAYQSDPMGRIGYLQSLLFRAARLVADTGIHAQRWNREEAISYLETTAGLGRPQAELEVDRYAVRPGVASAYMTGRETIRRLRAAAQKDLGPAFDLKAFHDAILAPGPRPLPVLEADIAAWIAARKPAAQPPAAAKPAPPATAPVPAPPASATPPPSQ